MKPEDRASFLEAAKDWQIKSAGQDLGEYFFKAACAHRDAQASAINEQMLEALKLAEKIILNAGDKGNSVYKKWKSAIAAAELHKEPKC